MGNFRQKRIYTWDRGHITKKVADQKVHSWFHYIEDANTRVHNLVERNKRVNTLIYLSKPTGHGKWYYNLKIKWRNNMLKRAPPVAGSNYSNDSDLPF